MSHVRFIADGSFTVTSVYSPTEGLAPQNTSLSADLAVVAKAPGVTSVLNQWKLTRLGVTLDEKSLLSTFELLDDSKGTGYYLCYDYDSASVVLKKGSRDAWVVTQHVSGPTKFQLSLPFTDKDGNKLLLTYASSNTQVTASKALTGDSDTTKQVWTIA